MAHVVERVKRPTLDAWPTTRRWRHQLFGEFKNLFPDNAVHFFVSYYDYYQPEAYVPSTRHVHREGFPVINEEIDRMRHAATYALLTRRDAIIVASVSLYLWHRRGRGLYRHEGGSGGRGRSPARRSFAPSGRDSIRTQRHRLLPRHLPIVGDVVEISRPTSAKRPCASNGGATRSRAISRRSIPLRGKVLRKTEEVWIFPLDRTT